MSEVEEVEIFTVVRNDEEQYSIWWASREIPRGWHEVGKRGTKDDCLTYIDQTWTDMRPLSLRKWMDEHPDPLDSSESESADVN